MNDQSQTEGGQTDTAPALDPGGQAVVEPAANADAGQQAARPEAGTASAATDAANGEETTDAAKTPVGAPAEYASFTTPEGVTLNPDLVGSFKERAKALNLTQEQAQGFVDIASQLAAGWEQQHLAAVDAARNKWRATATADPEIGGAEQAAKMAVVAKARDTFATPALREFLDASGLGDHPEVIRLLYRVGKAVSEDTLVTTGRPTDTQRTTESILFDKSARQAA
jgi:hypothetical protein